MKHTTFKTAIAMLAATVTLISGCRVVKYSFSGTSIEADVHTICVEPVVNRATKINPALANQLTEALNDKYRKLTSLEPVDENADLTLTTSIESYDVRAAAISANDVAAMNRLTVTAKIKFVNAKHPEDNVESSFAGYEDFDATQPLDAVEASLCDAIVEKIVDDIFNATVAQW